MPVRTLDAFEKVFHNIPVNPNELKLAFEEMDYVHEYQIEGLIVYACNLFYMLSEYYWDDNVQERCKMSIRKIQGIPYAPTTEERKARCLAKIAEIYPDCVDDNIKVLMRSFYLNLQKIIHIKSSIVITSPLDSRQNEELGVQPISWQ
jgi:hypothetical protein